MHRDVADLAHMRARGQTHTRNTHTHTHTHTREKPPARGARHAMSCSPRRGGPGTRAARRAPCSCRRTRPATAGRRPQSRGTRGWTCHPTVPAPSPTLARLSPAACCSSCGGSQPQQWSTADRARAHAQKESSAQRIANLVKHSQIKCINSRMGPWAAHYKLLNARTPRCWAR